MTAFNLFMTALALAMDAMSLAIYQGIASTNSNKKINFLVLKFIFRSVTILMNKNLTVIIWQIVKKSLVHY